MDYLGYHVRGNCCEIEDIQDHQVKEIIYPLDMNFQKNHTSMSNGFRNEVKSKTEYFKTKSAFNNGSSNENADMSNKTVNFLKTNYQQTSKNFYKTMREKL